MPGSDNAVYPTLVKAHTYAAFGGLILSACFGLTVSVKLNAPEFLAHASWLTWGRLRYDHTQGILYAWMGNAFLAFLYYAVPRITGHAVTSRRLGWFLFVVWNFIAVLGGWTLVLAGVNQPLEWAEFPLGVAAVIELALLLMIIQFIAPFWRMGAGDIYIAGWYLIGGISFTALAYPVGNILPHLLPGAMGAAFSGLWIHDAVGLFVTPFGVAIAYFVIPAVTRRPIYSHFYSMVGFWLLFLVYPLNGLHHYVYSSLPMGAQHASEVASVYQGIDVIIVVTNLLLSVPVMSEIALLADIPLRFIWTSVVLYLIVSIQGSLQAIMRVNSFIHFSDWVIGHSHLAMIGFASFAAMGGLAHIQQRLPGARLNRRLLAWSYWLLVSGLGLMVVDLTAAGLVQASLWHSHLPWIESVRMSRPYWIFRSLDGVVLITGFILFGMSFVTGEKNAGSDVQDAAVAQIHGAREGARWINATYAATFGAGLVFFVISFVALGILPAARLDAQIRNTLPARGLEPLTLEEEHGRAIYAHNGCAYCHTEQVRFTPDDIRRFGPPTEAWETDNQFPQMWGTRRIGPDLARESGKRSRDWQLAHLYEPRYTVPDSVMPPYQWLYAGSPDRPKQAALDLVAYLSTLGRDRGWSPSASGRANLVPASTNFLQADLALGRRVFLHNCSGCHGIDADGESPGGHALRPVAPDLAGSKLSQDLIWRALQEGVPGTSMPAWRTLPRDEFAAVASYVESVGRAPELTSAQRYASSAVLKEAGARIFRMYCARCHGADAAGDGPDASLSLPRPANFHAHEPSYATAEMAIRHGVPGSNMPAWPMLNRQEIQAVTFYIRSAFEPRAVEPAKIVTTAVPRRRADREEVRP